VESHQQSKLTVANLIMMSP